MPVKLTDSPEIGARLLASGTAVGLPEGWMMVKLLALTPEATPGPHWSGKEARLERPRAGGRIATGLRGQVRARRPAHPGKAEG